MGKSVFIHPSASIIGRVRLGDFSSVWPGCVLRADIHRIVVGHHTNIQDLSVLHVEHDQSCEIGAWTTVGHRVILHGCRVGDECLIGMGAIVLDGVRIQNRVLLGAGSLVTEGQVLEEGWLYFGSPAKKIRRLLQMELKSFRSHALRYVRYAKEHREGRYSAVIKG